MLLRFVFSLAVEAGVVLSFDRPSVDFFPALRTDNREGVCVVGGHRGGKIKRGIGSSYHIL